MTRTKDGTDTAAGWVPNLHWVLDTCVVSAPVKLETEPTSIGQRIVLNRDGPSDKRLPTALRRDGRYVYALPGGLEVCP